MKLTRLLSLVLFLWSLNSISQNCTTDQWLETYKRELGQELKDSDIIYELDLSKILLDQRVNYLGFIGKNKKDFIFILNQLQKKQIASIML